MRSSLLVWLCAASVAAAAPPAHDPEQRLQAVNAALAAHPLDLALWCERGQLHAELGALRAALADFRGVLVLDPGYGPALLAAARLEHLVGAPTAALVHLDAALARGTTGLPRPAELLRLRGSILGALGRHAEAAPAFAAALAEAAPPLPEHFLDLAAALAAEPAQVDAALAVLEQGLARLGPVVGLLDAAVALDVQQGQFARALQRLEPLRRRAARPAAWQTRRAAVIAAAGWRSAPVPMPVSPTAVPAVATGLAPAAAPPAARQLPRPAAILVPAGATWRYEDSGTDLGTAWIAPAYDDAAWASGPAQLGFGDGDEATVVRSGPAGSRWPTVYFRHTFQLSDQDLVEPASLRLLVDDGAIVSVNGTEVVRANVANGSVGYGTFAAWSIAGVEETTYRTFAVPPGLLVPGSNVLAVEVHQADANSSDLSFDLELATGSAPSLVRGPYLQNGTPTSAVVRWRTDRPTATHLWLGPTAAALQPVFTAAGPSSEHIATVTGLAPDTRYFYAVGDGAGLLSLPGPDYVLTTLPPAGAVRPLRIWALGDAGFGNFGQRAVRDLYRAFTGARGTDAILLLGDNAYQTGTDAEYQNGLFDVYGEFLRRTFCWATLGNHDAASARSQTQSGVYFDTFSLPTAGEAGGLPSGTEAYYSFDRGHVHIVCLDSMDSSRTAAGAMMTWLQADLQSTAARWVVVFFHHPPYSAGSHHSDVPSDSGGRLIDMRQVALPILEAAGVDLVLGGHSHAYERSFLLDGHYGASTTLQPAMVLDRGDGDEAGDGSYGKAQVGRSPHSGAVYVVAGSAGTIGGGLLNHPAMCRSLNRYGSLVLDVDGDRLDGTFVGVTGIEDRFTLVKGAARTLSRDQPAISLAVGGRQDLRLAAGSQHAGRTYVLAGSFGTSPGFSFRGAQVPLNQDPWFQLSLQSANSATYPGSLGTLDANGAAAAACVLTPIQDPSLVGVAVFHAFVVFDANGQLAHVSNPVKLTLRP